MSVVRLLLGSRSGVKLDREGLLSLLQLRDEHGVLSLYADLGPALRAAAPRPAWQVTIANELHAIEERVKLDGPRERWVALRERLDSLTNELQRLLDPSEPGRGRALFAPLGRDEVRTLSLQLPLPTRVVLDDSAYVRPLVAAADVARPTGLVTVSRDAVRVLDWRLGVASDLMRREFEQETSQWRELKGPAAGSPALVQQTAPQRDRFERRLDEQRRRFLQEAAESLRGLAATSGWLRLVVVGESPLRALLLDAFAGAPERELVEIDAQLESLPASELPRAVAGDLERSERLRQRTLAQRVRDDALAGRAASLGLRETLAALGQGRVGVLAFDRTLDVRGARTPDGRLVVAGESPPGAEPSELVAEPCLVERMIERALETGADVVALEPEAADVLSAEGGIGALLRW